MRLKHLIKTLGNDHSDLNLNDFEVRAISCNSKDIQDNSIFVAIKGTQADGHRFIAEAIKSGAKAIITHNSKLTTQNLEGISFIVVKDTRKTLAKLAAEFYGNPSSKMKVVGITGTNGKTTVSYLIEAILKAAERSPSVVGTINYRFKDKIIPAKNTTPGPLELQSLLASALRDGSDYAVMEVSSHALDQERIEGINFHCAIFTNLSQDHLDYHDNIENYFQAKAKLFKQANKRSFLVINNDDAYGRRIKEFGRVPIVTYAIDNAADVVAKDVKFDLTHTEFSLKTKQRQIDFRTPLIGRYNVYNVLASAAFALREGIDLGVIKSALERFAFVPGRLEKIVFNGKFCVFVDYAHTEDALKNVINTLRQLSKKRIIVVFGCGGERDKTKRPKMGYAVSELADYAIITNDNPRSEDPQDIIDDIKKGIKKNNYTVIPERLEAIKKSLLLAKTGDLVLVAGKGHEDYQILKGRIVHFDDREVVKKCLASMNY